MIVLLSGETEQHLTGGYFYNEHLIRELSRSTPAFYLCETVETILADDNIRKKIESAEIVLVDSIFFSMPERLQKIFTGTKLNAQGIPEKVLLLHWLPWIEEEEISREFHANPGNTANLLPPSIGEQAKALLPLFDRYICTSKFSKRALMETGIAPDLICTAYPGVTVQRNRQPRPAGNSQRKQPLRFSTLAHWTPVKGIHRIPPLLEELREYDWRWIACGSVNDHTPYGRQVLSAVDEAGIQGRVELPGPLPHEQALQAIQESTCLLVPSLFETYGMAAAESAASGTPVIGFETGGLPEAVSHGRDGFLCSSISQFGDTLKRVLEDPSILPRPAAESAQPGEKSWEQTAETVRFFLRGHG